MAGGREGGGEGVGRGKKRRREGGVEVEKNYDCFKNI